MSHFAEAFLSNTVNQSALSARADELSVSIVEDFKPLAEEWNRLLSNGHASGYQSFAFQQIWANASASIDGSRSVAAVLRNKQHQIVAILPLALKRSGGVTVARMTGGKHVNFNMPIAAPGALPNGSAQLTAILNIIGQSAGIDLFAFINQPQSWNERPHPFLALGGQQSPSPAYKLALQEDADALIKERLSQDARHKLRRKFNRLTDLGALRFAEASTRDEAEAVLRAFLMQKNARMRAQGLADPFAGPGMEAFLRGACLDGIENGQSAIRLFGLWLGDRVIATYGAVVDERRFSGMFTSFDTSEDVVRWSPGEHLLHWLIRHHCEKGLKEFDLGVGEASYKSQLCNQQDVLFDLIVPVTAKGKASTLMMQTIYAAKRSLKQNRFFMPAYTKARKLFGNRLRAA
jgi:CelD/BcsL family acetyltransferase involved in cellulose biosynthesis